MSNIGKKVRILDSYNTPASKSYIGQIGTIISDKSDNDYYVIQMIDGRKLMPFRENYTEPQCELVADEPVNDKWYVRCIDDGHADEYGANKLTIGKEYEYTDEDNETISVIDDINKTARYYHTRFTPKYQKQQAMNTDINEQIVALEKQINDLKEQVNNPYKVGDKYKVIQKELKHTGSIVTIVKLERGFHTFIDENGDGWNIPEQAIKATEAEIEANKEKVIEIGSENKQVKIRKDKIEVDGKKLKPIKLSDIINGMYGSYIVGQIGGWDVMLDENIRCIKLGCVGSSARYSIADMKKVIDEHEKLNK